MANTPYDYALSLLAARAYTVRGMRRKLVQKGFDPKDVEATVERLLSSGLLDDARFAAEFARQRLVVGGRPLGGWSSSWLPRASLAMWRRRPQLRSRARKMSIR